MMILGKAVQMSDDQHIKAVVWLGGILAAAVAAAFATVIWAEDRYQHKTETAEALAQVNAKAVAAVQVQDAKLSALTEQVQYSGDLNEKRRIESELFKLEQTPEKKLTNVDRAQKSKLERDLKALVDTWTAKGRPLR